MRMRLLVCVFFALLVFIGTNVHGKAKEKLPPQDASLLTAAFKGRAEMALDALRRGADVECRDGKEGNTPLIFAARHGHIEVIDLLLNAGANIEALSHDGEKTPLLMAAYSGNPDVVEELLKRGASVESTNQRGDTPLLLACYSGSVAVVRLLLSRGASINRRSIKHAYSPLYVSASAGYSHIVAELLRQTDEVDVDITDKTGRTPLHVAVAEKYPGIARQLVQAGASVEMRDGRGNNPLFTAVKANCAECVAILVGRGEGEGRANVNSREGSSRFTALMRASSLGYADVMQVLLDAGAEVEVAVPRNRTTPAAGTKEARPQKGRGAASSSLIEDAAEGDGEDEEDNDEDEDDEEEMDIEITFVDDRGKGDGDDDKDGDEGVRRGDAATAAVRSTVRASSQSDKRTDTKKKSLPGPKAETVRPEPDHVPMVTALSLVRNSGCRRCVELLEEKLTCSAEASGGDAEGDEAQTVLNLDLV